MKNQYKFKEVRGTGVGHYNKGVLNLSKFDLEKINGKREEEPRRGKGKERAVETERGDWGGKRKKFIKKSKGKGKGKGKGRGKKGGGF